LRWRQLCPSSTPELPQKIRAAFVVDTKLWLRYITAALKEVGWSKGLELAKVARRDREGFDCATWLQKAREMPKEEFKREVEKELTGKETEPWEIVYFKLYKSQSPVIEQAIETAALMLGTDKSRGYCLEMICADFLAGANLEKGNSGILLESIERFFKFLPGHERQTFLRRATQRVS
jgi:hypothetical protein